MSLLLALTGSVTGASGVISWTEQDDVVSVTGSVATSSCSVAWIEESDSLTISGISLAVDTNHGHLREFSTLFSPLLSRKRVKKLQDEAREIIELTKDADPQEVEQLFDDAAEISRKLQEAIAAFEQAAAGYQQRLNEQAQQRATAQARELQSLLIQAQLQAELMQQQVEELDVCYVMMMMAVHV
jgi:hypothetical protein